VKHATEQGTILEGRLAKQADGNADSDAARALFDLTWPAKITDTRTQLAESKSAIALLEKATAVNPGALDGDALWTLGRLYYDLPAFAGGDSAKGQQLLEEAYRRTPKSVSLLRYCAYVYVQERNPTEAKKRLEAMLTLTAPPAQSQLLVDELKGASELAVRLQDQALAQQLIDKRTVLLEANPQLLRRQRTAANQHGGVDPISGKDY
jgi:tetratricopeptide (TPR) repeat protein